MPKVKVHKAPQTMRFDDEQINDIMEYLDRRMDNYCEQIKRSNYAVANDISTKKEDEKPDIFSSVIKSVLGVLLLIIGVAELYGLFVIPSKVFIEKPNIIEWIGTFVCGVIPIIGGIEIFKEKSRTYIVQVFSSLVSLVALIVALIALNKK